MHRNLIPLCQKVGKNIPTWTQGAGGNISEKDGTTLWIKASGKRLEEVTATSGVASLNLTQFLAILSSLLQNSSNLPLDSAEASYSQALRTASTSQHLGTVPSMESGFHALLPKRFVIHMHSLVAVLMAFHQERSQDAKRFEDWLGAVGDPETFQFFPYLVPGLSLSTEVGKFSQKTFFILKNHGVILQSDRPEILEEWQRLEKQFCRDWNYSALGEALEAQSPFDWVKDFVGKTAPEGPVSLYFPDTAVFYEPISQFLSNQGGLFSLPRTIETGNKNQQSLTEIWLATRFLAILQKDLTEIPNSQIQHLNSLPTEQHRRGL